MTITEDYRRGRHVASAMRKVCDDFGVELRKFNGKKMITCTCWSGTRLRWASPRW